ncbi:MAG: AbrB/MazE/SpoVT family DNA-binding domain-containing protein [Chloroflexi bacterium]|nr:AbrB/MazE/SpoVT family DNA-binding domain-containing protein [Chloroflexota bacterium]
MAETVAVRMAQRGGMTLPKALRERYNLKPGDTLTLVDLDGVLVLSPRRSEVGALADELKKALVDRGETLESVLAALRAERERRA